MERLRVAVFIHLKPVKPAATVLVTVVAEGRTWIMIVLNKKYWSKLAPLQECTLYKECAFYEAPSAYIGAIREALPTDNKHEECLCADKTGCYFLHLYPCIRA